MPLDDTGAEQPLELALKRALLEAALFRRLGDGSGHTGIERHSTDLAAKLVREHLTDPNAAT